MESLQKSKKFWLVNLFLLFCFLAIVAIIKFGPNILSKLPPSLSSSLPKIISKKPSVKIASEVAKFKSEEEFKKYLEKSEETFEGGYGIAPMGLGMEERAVTLEAPDIAAAPQAAEKAVAPERVSETTVQVAGIDEPDIVKTDGTKIYFSSDMPVFRSQPEPIEPMPLVDEKRAIAPGNPGIIPPRYEAETKIVKAFPPADLEKIATIEKTGNLLLEDNILVIFSNQDIYGFDVSDPKNPQQKWKLGLQTRNRLITSRLYKGKIYLFTQTSVNSVRPCPISVLEGSTNLTVKCIDIYHPITSVPVDVAFTAMALDPSSGSIDKTTSFVGSSSSSVVYMSQDNLFITYTYTDDMIGFFYKLFKEEASDLVSSDIIQRLEKIKDYDISSRAKWIEIQTILEEYKNSLDDDKRLKMENEFTNRMSDFVQKNARALEKTGIAKIDLSDMEVAATGGVPGRPLNQFSLDEYKGHLRMATTTGQQWMFGVRPNESVNDIYVLDKNLETVGSVLDLGLGERIYSARFIENKGYLVTFKQIDPFYVLDLSDPENPEKKGELKIPGYSSYLHPITKDKILGIGREGQKVKVSLFDVSNPANPTELDKYMLNEYWSEVESTHHAFLLDTKHQVFFLPGSQGGYVFSYKTDLLQLTKAVSDIRAKRAIYLDDYLYIVGEDKIAVLNELDWEKVNELEF